MQELVLHLIDERGPIRLVIELAIGLGSLATAAVWSAQWLLARRRRSSGIEAVAPDAERHFAA